jgi:hypothetical protein
VSEDAVLAHAALREGGMTETEIATATGLSLIRTKFALDELAILAVAAVDEEDGLLFWRLRKEAVR